MSESPLTAPALQGKLWAIVFFVTGGIGVAYEVGWGHDKVWGVFCAFWAAGGPTLAADRMLRGSK